MATVKITLAPESAGGNQVLVGIQRQPVAEKLSTLILPAHELSEL
ncbi:MAG: hypothetical protein ACM37W_27215 [Actinomycetota bacterium]